LAVEGRILAVLLVFLRGVLEKAVVGDGYFDGEIVVKCMVNVESQPSLRGG
jgi:hypothetical protein